VISSLALECSYQGQGNFSCKYCSFVVEIKSFHARSSRSKSDSAEQEQKQIRAQDGSPEVQDQGERRLEVGFCETETETDTRESGRPRNKALKVGFCKSETEADTRDARRSKMKSQELVSANPKQKLKQEQDEGPS
jgi:hypothetical protein